MHYNKIIIIMNKSNKTKREKELEKQIKKLRSEKEQLKKESRSLKSKLETAKGKIERFKKEFKKKASEGGKTPRSAGESNEVIARHWYAERTIALCTTLYSRLPVGSRTVVKIMEIFNEFTDNAFGDVPAHTTIGYWTQELGLGVLEDAPGGLRGTGTPYAIIVDVSMMIGSQKLLLLLGAPAINGGGAVCEKDLTVLGVHVAKSWNSKSIREAIDETVKKVGAAPEFIISDNDSTICKAVRDGGYAHHLDVSHTMGMFLERTYKEDTEYKGLSTLVQGARLKYNMQEVAVIQPPSQRSIARFMNLFDWVEWARRMQDVYHNLSEEARAIYAFIPANASLVSELSETMECYGEIERCLKTKGLSKESAEWCRGKVRNNLMAGGERMRKVGTSILQYLDREEALLVDKDAPHNICSDPIETTFGVHKARKSPNKLYGVSPIVLALPLRVALATPEKRKEFNFKERMEKSRHKKIKEWTEENLLPNMVSLRRRILKKTA